MPVAATSEKEKCANRRGPSDYACSGCFPFDSGCDSECKRDKNSGSKKGKKRKEKSSERQKKEAAGGYTQCTDVKVRRVGKRDAKRSSHSNLGQHSKEKLCKDKLGKDQKSKDANDGKVSKRKEVRGKSKKEPGKSSTKLNAVYSCTEAKLNSQDVESCETDAKQKEKSCDESSVKQKEKLCKETQKQLKEIEKEMKQNEKEAKRIERARSRSKDKKKCQKSSVKLRKHFKSKNMKNPTLTQIGNSAEMNCTRCCELLGLYLQETYRFYTCVCSDKTQATHFQETFCLLMKSLSCMCRDCYMLVRYIWRLLFV